MSNVGKNELNIQQQAAVEEEGEDIIVSAAAGSGKTRVLTERVVNLLEVHPEYNIDSMIIVTFTKKAAAEMKSKIAKKLAEKNMEDQLMRLPSAQVCTIDSFFMDLVRENSAKVHVAEDETGKYFSLSNDFTHMDEEEEDSLKNLTLQKIIDELFAEKDENFITLYDMFSSVKYKNDLFKLVKDLYKFMYTQVDPFGWLENAIECYNPDKTDEKIWYRQLQDRCSYLASEIKKITDYIFTLIENYDEKNKVKERLIKISETLDGLINNFNLKPEELTKIITDFSKSGFSITDNFLDKNIDPNCPPKIKTEIYNGCNEYTSIKNDIKGIKSYLLMLSTIEYDYQTENLYSALKGLKEVIKKFDYELMLRKNEQNRYSYDDISHFALNLLTNKENGKIKIDNDGNLTPSEIAESLKNSYSAIMVDEYQDTNRVQDAVFSLLSKDNLFMVGDVKQSIYRFRRAVPEIFIEKLNKNGEAEKQNNPSNTKALYLNGNYRSCEGICNYVNFVFSNFMSKQVGYIDYNKKEYLEHRRAENNETTASYEPGCAPVKLEIIEGVESAEDAREKEAQQIAQMIKSRVKHKEQIKDGNSYRDIRYSDFAILFRKAKGKINIYIDALKKAGIPYSYNINDNPFDYGEIELIISLLRVINNPTSDVDLLNVMLSPLYSFSPDDIAKIRYEIDENDYNSENPDKNSNSEQNAENNAKHKHGRVPFHQLMFKVNLEKIKDPDLKERGSAFLNDIERLRCLSLTMSMADFISLLCDEKDIYAYAFAISNAEEGKANIQWLINFAATFDTSENSGLPAFLRLFDNVGKADVPLPADSAENSVTLITVHKAKGLEYPIVIYADPEGKIKHEFNQLYYFDQEIGVGIQYIDPSERYIRNTIQYDIIKSRYNEREKSEAMRVLYVAITRAREQFISFIAISDGKNGEIGEGIKNKILNISSKIYNGTINSYECSKMNHDADYLLTAAIMHGDKGSDGKTLCEHYELDQPECPSSENFKFDVDIEYIGEDTEKSESAATGETAATEAPADPQPEEPKQVCTSDPETKKAIAAKIETPCFDPSLTALPAKCNASELKKIKLVNPDPNNLEDPRLDKNLNSEFYGNMNAKPSFIPEKSTNKKGSGSKASSSEEAADASATERGTAMHDFMQFCSPEFMRAHHDDVKTADIEKEIERMVDAGQITARQAELLNKEQLVVFTKSELAGRMFSVSEDKLYREKRVMSFMPASKAYGIDSEEKVLVQGIADCVFEEDGKLILVDYKTDTFDHKTDNPSGREKAKEDLKNHYRDQVNFYRQALKKALGKEVSEAFLYSFVLGEEISVEE